MILSKERIDYVRADRGMTLDDIAKAGKCSTATVQKAMKGIDIAVMPAGRIAKALNVPLEYLAVNNGSETNDKERI